MTDCNPGIDKTGPVILISGAHRSIDKTITEELVLHRYRISLGSGNPAALDAAFPQLDEHHCYHYADALNHEPAGTWVNRAVARCNSTTDTRSGFVHTNMSVRTDKINGAA